MLLEQKIESTPLTKGVLWLITMATGMVVANNYYSQPLLGLIAKDLQVSESVVSRIPMFTQIGYAVGLLTIIPLGDMVRRKRLILLDFVLIITLLIAFSLSRSIYLSLAIAFAIGLFCVIPQVFIPMVAQISHPDERNKNVAQVMTGLLIGILLSRVFSGFVGEYWGWREMYLIAASFMLVLAILLAWILPNVTSSFHGTYRQLMQSIFYYAKTIPSLRFASLRGGLAFASFSVFWTVIAFRMEGAPYFQGSDVAGALGVFGVAGALGTSLGNYFIKRSGARKVISMSCLLLIFSWLIFGIFDSYYIGLVVGVILIDLGLAVLNVTNQLIVFSSHPDASSRLNTVYMSSYFIGGALGSFGGGIAWSQYGWIGVVVLGSAFAILCLLSHIFLGRTVNTAS